MKTYTLSPVSIKGGQRGSWSTSAWNLYTLTSNGERRIGRNKTSGYNYATYFLFDPTALAALTGKTILSITLSMTVLSGNIPASTSHSIHIGYKYNGDEGTSSNTQAWARGDAGSTEISGNYEAGYFRNATGGRTDADNTTLQIDLTGSDVPKYGYVIGPDSSSVETYCTVANNAVLTIVTDEVSTFTVTYDANGGSGAPAAQTKQAGVALTLSSTEPLRSGYMFLGWNSASDGTGADYQAGGQYAIDADVTLYAKWQQITQTGVWVKGSGNQMHQGTEWVKGSDNQMHAATLDVKDSDNQMHQSS
jgi:uncharacterized repeat protein (TIGR02543 family)